MNVVCGDDNQTTKLGKTVSFQKPNEATFLLKQLLELADTLRTRQTSIPTRSNVVSERTDAIEYSRTIDCIRSELEVRRAGGESYAALAIDLNRRGLRGRYGGRWYTASVRALLQRNRSKGIAC